MSCPIKMISLLLSINANSTLNTTQVFPSISTCTRYPHLLSCLCLPHKTLKRKEKEYEHEMERLAREKIATQQRLAELKNELSQCMDVIEIDRVLRQTIQPEDDQASTSTASGTEMRFNDSPAHILYIHHLHTWHSVQSYSREASTADKGFLLTLRGLCLYVNIHEHKPVVHSSHG